MLLLSWHWTSWRGDLSSLPLLVIIRPPKPENGQSEGWFSIVTLWDVQSEVPVASSDCIGRKISLDFFFPLM